MRETNGKSADWHRAQVVRPDRQAELRRGLAALCRLLGGELFQEEEAFSPADQSLGEAMLFEDWSDPDCVAALSEDCLNEVAGGVGISPDAAGQLRAAAQCFLADAIRPDVLT